MSNSLAQPSASVWSHSSQQRLRGQTGRQGGSEGESCRRRRAVDPGWGGQLQPLHQQVRTSRISHTSEQTGCVTSGFDLQDVKLNRGCGLSWVKSVECSQTDLTFLHLFLQIWSGRHWWRGKRVSSLTIASHLGSLVLSHLCSISQSLILLPFSFTCLVYFPLFSFCLCPMPSLPSFTKHYFYFSLLLYCNSSRRLF